MVELVYATGKGRRPMPYRSLTVKELAQMIGADARRLERMAQRGEIPC